MQNADKVTLRVGRFSSVDHILSIGCISSIGLRVVAFWAELNS